MEKFCAGVKTNSKVDNVHSYQHIWDKNKFIDIEFHALFTVFGNKYFELHVLKYYSTWQQCKLRNTNLQKQCKLRVILLYSCQLYLTDAEECI